MMSTELSELKGSKRIPLKTEKGMGMKQILKSDDEQP